jgi:hypothetical protein
MQPTYNLDKHGQVCKVLQRNFHEGSRRAWRSRRSRIGIKFIDPMNRTYGVDLPKYQNTGNPKYQKSRLSNTLMRP